MCVKRCTSQIAKKKKKQVINDLAINDLLNHLEQARRLKHTVYTDDITLWCNTGFTAPRECTLQKGIEIVLDYTKAIGLS